MSLTPQAEHIPVPANQTEPTGKIGRVVAVTGAHAIILLEKDNVLPDDAIHKSPEIGTLLKVETEPSIALALISSLSTPTPGGQTEGEDLRIVEVEFIGELPKDQNGTPGKFRRGISCYPALGDIVARASTQELAMAYASEGDIAVRVGHIKQDASIPAMVKTDELLGKHFAILGTTGTGKSCTVALILRRILEDNPLAHILLLDVHREYASAFQDFGEIITPANLNLPFWLLNFEEMVEIIIAGQKNREADIEILRELIPMAKQRYKGGRTGDKTSKLRSRDSDDGTIGVDTPVPYRISDITGLLDEALGKLELKGELAPYKRLKARIEQLSRDARYSFMFGSLTVHDSMAEIIGHLFRIPVEGKPITILELGGLPSEIINVVVSVLARMAFDFGLWSGGQVPLTFVCEEAHRYVPFDDTLGFEPTKRAISKIAKEGRKYGVSLCIVSQRPAELDPTIMSQCSTVFSMRLTNERDQDLLRAGISDAAASLLEFMPTMGTGEAVAFGEGVALPTRIKFDLLPPNCLPKSNTASFSKNWNRDVSDPSFLDNIVACWREQTQITNIGFTASSDAVTSTGSKADRATQPGQAAGTQPPQPVADTPVQANPVQANPVQANPVQANPVQANPVQANPVQANPVQANPVQASPVQPNTVPPAAGQFAQQQVPPTPAPQAAAPQTPVQQARVQQPQMPPAAAQQATAQPGLVQPPLGDAATAAVTPPNGQYMAQAPQAQTVQAQSMQAQSVRAQPMQAQPQPAQSGQPQQPSPQPAAQPAATAPTVNGEPSLSELIRQVRG